MGKAKINNLGTRKVASVVWDEIEAATGCAGQGALGHTRLWLSNPSRSRVNETARRLLMRVSLTM